MNKTPDHLNSPASARRKLLKGGFAVPAVLTLRSGSTYAAGSIGLCLVKQNNAPATVPVSASDDGFLRYQLYAYVKTGGSTNIGSIREVDGYWIKGSELSVFVRSAQQPFVTTSYWQRFDIITNNLSGSPISSTPVCTASTPTNFTLQKVAKWVSLRVSSTGQIVGAGNSTSGSAVGDSCWNSFAAATTP